MVASLSWMNLAGVFAGSSHFFTKTSESLRVFGLQLREGSVVLV